MLRSLVGSEMCIRDRSWTLKTLMDAGYIRLDTSNGSSRFFWTHNREVDSLPVA